MTKRIFLMAIIGILLCSCHNDGIIEESNDDFNEAQTPYISIPVTENTRSVSKEVNEFSVDLFREIAASENKNMVQSPYSVFCVLAMMGDAYIEEAQSEILKTLGFEANGEGLTKLNDFCKTMNEYLPNIDSWTKCEMANSVWVENGVAVDQEIEKTYKDVFKCDVFAIEKALLNTKLDSWIAENTNNRIVDFSKGKDLQFPAIVNTSYFKGKWKTPFDKANTKKGKFVCIDNKKVTTLFMNTQLRAAYSESDGWECVSLPYGNGNFELVAILPPTDKKPNEVNSQIISDLNVNAFYADATVSLPKFDITSNVDMLGYIHSMGITKISDLNNCQCKLFNSGFWCITQFIHECNISVSETGTEAAAVSFAGGFMSAGDEPETVSISFDRPFLYMIRETSTKTILFMGQVVKF